MGTAVTSDPTTTFEIRYADLFAPAPAHLPKARWPLDRLTYDDNHIHGLLEITIAGRALPSMSYFEDGEVCINEWVDVLLAARRDLSVADVASYVYDDAEQGQPGYRFDRKVDTLNVSVIEGVRGGGRADPSFQRVACRWADFVREVDAFLTGLHASVLSAAPVEGTAWWAERSADNEPSAIGRQPPASL